jgi:hypothetical protein
MNDTDLVYKDLLHEFRGDVAPIEPALLARARADLLRQTRTRSTRRPSKWVTGVAAPRVGWRPALAAGFALAVAGGLVAINHLGAPADSRGGGSATADKPSQTDAARILRGAALVAQQSEILPARPDQFVFIESISDGPESFGCTSQADQSTCVARPGVLSRSLVQAWGSVDGTRDGLTRVRQQPASGAWYEVPVPACPPAPSVAASNETARPDWVCVPRPAYRVDLPTNPDAMVAYLRQPPSPLPVPPRPAPPLDPADTFHVAYRLLDGYLPPNCLAALFEALARIPGLRTARAVVDAAGRHGVSVYLDRDGRRGELIFDPVTYTYLGGRTVTLHDTAGLKAGSTTDQSARLRVAIVDQARQLP